MRILTLIPEGYTLLNTIKQSFEKMNHEVINLNYSSFFKYWQNRLITKTTGLPYTVKNRIKIHDQYRKKINKLYLEHVYNYKPDLVFVYNDQYLTFDFILGDNPFFFHNHPLRNLGMYLNADYVFSCDSYITKSFEKAGQKNVSEIYFGYDPTICYSKKPTQEQRMRYSSDVVMIGRLYPTIISTWTYKRLFFFNQFKNLDLKIYGPGWHKYKEVFPELIQKANNPGHYLSFDEVNTILSCCKLYPVEANPGIFKDVEIPIIKNYNDAEKLAIYYIKNDKKREQIKKELKQFVDSNYTPQKAAKKILDKVFN